MDGGEARSDGVVRAGGERGSEKRNARVRSRQSRFETNSREGLLRGAGVSVSPEGVSLLCPSPAPVRGSTGRSSLGSILPPLADRMSSCFASARMAPGAGIWPPARRLWGVLISRWEAESSYGIWRGEMKVGDSASALS